MAMAMMNKTAGNSVVDVAKTSLMKQRARNLVQRLVQQWQRIVDDQRQLWNAYGTSAHARGTPRCVWRRHGALLVYAKAKHHYPVMHKKVR